jgi:hypothetical protein
MRSKKSVGATEHRNELATLHLPKADIAAHAPTSGTGEDSQSAHPREQLPQELEPLAGKIGELERQPGDAAAGPRQARH